MVLYLLHAGRPVLVYQFRHRTTGELANIKTADCSLLCGRETRGLLTVSALCELASCNGVAFASNVLLLLRPAQPCLRLSLLLGRCGLSENWARSLPL